MEDARQLEGVGVAEVREVERMADGRAELIRHPSVPLAHSVVDG